MRIQTAIFHGPSGSGKDTQLDLLAKKVDYKRIAASSVMEELKKEGSELALRAEEYGKRGELYPDEFVYEMFDTWVSRLDPEAKWFFVSPVRKSTQIRHFDDLMVKYSRKLELFVHFDLSDEAAIERMSLRSYCPICRATYHSKYKPEKNEGLCDNDGAKLLHREDDSPEAIKKRLSWYRDDIDPILAEYESRGLLLRVDAAPSIQEIHSTLLKKLLVL